MSPSIHDRPAGTAPAAPTRRATVAPAHRAEPTAAAAATPNPTRHNLRGTTTAARAAIAGAKAAGAAPAPPRGLTVDRNEETTVVSINVKAFQLSDGGDVDERAFDAIERYIEQVDADVVLFQELDNGTRRAGGPGADQLAEIARRVDADDTQFAKAIDHQGGEYGLGILTRNGHEIADDAQGRNKAHTVQLPKSSKAGADSEQRVALAAAIETPGGNEFTAITTHLSTKDTGRSAQVQKLDDMVEDITGGASNDAAGLPDDLPTEVVLGGDFNQKRGPVEEHLDGVTHVSELDDDLGNTGIDHVYVSDGIGVQEAHLDKPETIIDRWLPFGLLDVHATDHPAVRTTITFG